MMPLDSLFPSEGERGRRGRVPALRSADRSQIT